MKVTKKLSIPVFILIATLIVFQYILEAINSELSTVKINNGRLPNKTELLVDNGSWQFLNISDGRLLYLMNAYLDVHISRTITIITFKRGINVTEQKIFCQLWMKDQVEPVIVNASFVKGLERIVVRLELLTQLFFFFSLWLWK